MKKYDETFEIFNSDQGPGNDFMIVKDQEIIHQKGYGFADIDQKTPITPDTLFDMASVSKQFTAMAIAMLEEKGKIDPNQSIRFYLPDLLEYTQAVKVKHLIHHQSGISEYIGMHFDDKQRQHVSYDDVVEHINVQTALEFPPGSRLAYCNSNYILLAIIVAKVTGKSFEQFIKEQIFSPLGMNASTVLSTATAKEKESLATGYEQWPFFHKCSQCPLGMTAGDGQIAITLNDFYQWIISLEESKLVSPKTMEKIFTPVGGHPEKLEPNYGYGWDLGEIEGYKVARHTGGWKGFSTYVAMFPEKKLWVVAFGNYEGGLRFMNNLLIELVNEKVNEKVG